MEVLKLKITILEMNNSLVFLVVKMCPTLCDLLDCSQAGSSLRGISQARILEWVTISFSRGSSWPLEASNPHLLHWQADALLLSHQESEPYIIIVLYLYQKDCARCVCVCVYLVGLKKSSLGGLTSIVKQTEERMTKFENGLTIQYEVQKEKIRREN